MSAPIELTAAEHQAAIVAVWGTSTADADAIVGKVVEAINAVRLGDPAGTLKRNKKTGDVAERRETDTGFRYWHQLTKGGKTVTWT